VAFDRTNAGSDVEACVRLDAAAQQLSACAWLITCVEPEPRDSDLCIGHVVPFVQHAIRASGVDCHPAQIGRFPTLSVRTATIAASRPVSVSTSVECGTTAALSNHHRSRLDRHRSFCLGSPVWCSVI